MRHLPHIVAFALFIALGVLAALALDDVLAIVIADKDLPDTDRMPPPGASRPLELRMVDLGAVGIAADADGWGQDYLHHERRFLHAFSADEPFIDDVAFASVRADFRAYIDRMAGLGFNAIDVEGFLQFVDFDRLGDGHQVYPEDSVYRRRHQVFRKYFGELFQYAQRRGFRVFLRTDMVALTPPLEAYLRAEIGDLDVTSDGFWQVYQRGLEELFDHFPEAAGIMIRIGEAGAVYNLPGWDYSSQLLVRTDGAVERMLEAFLEVAEARDKLVVFRSWSVGVGQVGAMHTRPEVYERVLGDIDSEHLIVSTKFVRGDFWNHLPLNPTLLAGRHKRLVEFQARREFEAFNVVPNYVGPLHQFAVRTLLAKNPQIIGIWLWTQHGGPLRHGPMMLYPFHGMWLWDDANVYATAAIVADPSRPIDDITDAWIRDNLGTQPDVVRGMRELLNGSHATLIKGLTVPSFARRDVRGMGIEIPPVIYSYWDIIGTSTSITSHIYYVTRDDIDGAIADGFDAVREVEIMRAQLDALDGKLDAKGQAWYPAMRESLAYEHNLLATTAQHKRFLLRFYQWLDRGGDEREARWRNAIAEFKRARAVHLERHAGNLDFPAYNFELADAGVRQAERVSWAMWAARLLLVLLVAALVMAIPLWYRDRGPLTRLSPHGLRALAAVFLSVLIVGTLGAFTSFTSVLFVAAMGLPGGAYLLCLYYLVLGRQRPGSFAPTVLPFLAFAGFMLAVMAIRGPLYFWYHFWVADSFRLVFVVVATACALGHCYILISCIVGPLNRRRVISATAALAASIGAIMALVGSAMLMVGFERSLSRLNDALLLIPGMTSRVLGLTTHLNIPTTIPAFVLGVGLGFLAIGIVLLALLRWRGPRSSRGDHA